ncbi:hypothetical protein MG293_012382 [Ovis ammon polii]|uniref:G-protein coupled receptors family 1 profile domain-containing protein n=1 Tax=Ovis ammon polii TaxID=230172 RepID=A0AAD4Y7D9_OVIAM|nr:hypothetical protein MG293_012382 [Ovis ammon polii]
MKNNQKVEKRSHRFGHVVPSTHILLSTIYLLVPPALNPIVYGVKNKVLIFSFVPLLECDCESRLWFNSKPYGNCKLQQYPVLHLLSHRYATILTPTLITKIGIAVLLRSAFAMIPLLAQLAFFPFCYSHILSHSYCLHQDVIRLACGDTKFNVMYGMVMITLLWGMDSLGIFMSYVFILHSVLKISSQEGRFKALNTCASHICAVLILYVPMIGLSVVHRFAKHSSPFIHIFMAHIYLLVPPVLNPIIYSVKTKQIHQGFLHLVFPLRISSSVM